MSSILTRKPLASLGIAMLAKMAARTLQAPVARPVRRRSAAGAGTAVALVAVVGLAAWETQRLTAHRRQRQHEKFAVDYADRSGFPKPANEMRGVAAELARAPVNGPVADARA